MAGDKVCNVDKVGGLDGLLAKAQVRDRDAAGLLGVVAEVALGVHIRMVADDLDGVFVGANRTIRTKTKELRAEAAFRGSIDRFFDFQRGAGDIVHNTHGEVVLGSGSAHVVEHGLDERGRELLAAQTIAAAEDAQHTALLEQSGDDILVKRLTQGAGLFGSIEHREGFHAGRDGIHKRFSAKRTVQVDFQDADLLALLV